jgi:hypothetical protein
MNCCICGPVKNCGPFIEKVLENMEKIGKIFDDYAILIFYDKSHDDTLDKLKKYQLQNPKMKLYISEQNMYPYRTHNIARARNFCLEYIKKNSDLYPYFIMMDCDDVNCKTCNPEILRKYLNRNDWDSLSFNTSPKYYDIWALSIYPYCFSYNHFENNVLFYDIIQKDIMHRLNTLPKDKLLESISSFNGFSIYKTQKFMNTYYDGKIRKDLISQENMEAHIEFADSPLVYKKYVTSDCRYEDCEHRAFHIMAAQNSGARIMISPEIIFS